MSSSETEIHSTTAYSRLLVLAKGGMGEVEIALRQEGDFRRLYAIKRLLPHLRDDEGVRTMFLAEARIAGLIRHSNVVSVLDVGEDHRGPFLVMDYIEGVPVSVAIRKHQQIQEPLPLQLVLRIIAEAARGLHAAHELFDPDGTPRPIVHRDVSPQNILLGFDGVTRVTDFGVAKALGNLAQTDGDVLKGKVGYMSPEQLRFKPIDGRSDLYSLAVVLYELLTCERLYGPSSDIPAPRRILEEPPPDLGEERADLPPKLVALCFQLFAKDPNHRPTTAKEVADRLDAIRATMEAEQGVVSLADHLRIYFSAEWEQHKSAVAQAMKSSDRLFAPPGPAVGRLEDPRTLDLGPKDETTTIARRSKPRIWLWLVALGAGLAVAAAVGLWFGLERAEQGQATTREIPNVEEEVEVPATISAGSNDTTAVVPIAADSSPPSEDPDSGVITPTQDRRRQPRARQKRSKNAPASKARPTDGNTSDQQKASTGPRYTPWSYED